MIEIRGLTKQYGPLTALRDLNLSVAPGECLGLLGPNGAGKTTTLRLLAGLARPTSGTVRVAGHDPWQEPEAVHRLIGLLPEGAALYERWTVAENLLLFAGLYGLPKARVEEALALVGAADLLHRRAGKLSKGQRQRVALARALLHNPRLLFLDEPTSGLDPVAAAHFHQLVRRLLQEGVTVILSSHDMLEVDQLCTRVAVLDRGELRACGEPAYLKAAFGGSRSATMADVFIQVTGRGMA
jgi:heme ABC exporter ATP-binding subunit CcmA